MASTFRLRPGQRINEVELARQLGVSRTPVREALNRIAAEGFLEASPNRGYTVRPLDTVQIQNLYEFRKTIELGIVRQVCQHATDAELQALAEFTTLQNRQKPADDTAAIHFLWCDEQFHVRLAQLSRNEEFVRAITRVNERIRFARWIDIRRGLGNMTPDHLQLVRLLQARDLAAAQALMELHVERRLDQLVELIRDSFAEIYTENALAAYAEQQYEAEAQAAGGLP